MGPEGSGGEEGERPKGGGPKFRRFFFFVSRHQFHSFCVSSRGILVLFLKRRGLKCARLEFSGCRVKPQRPRSRRDSEMLWQMAKEFDRMEVIQFGPTFGRSCPIQLLDAER